MKIYLWFVCGGTVVGAWFFGDETQSFAANPLNAVRWVIAVGVLRALKWAGRTCLPASWNARAEEACVYVFHKPNPILQALYLVLVLGGYGLFLVVVQPRFGRVEARAGRAAAVAPAAWHAYGAAAAVTGVMAAFAAACRARPGVIRDDPPGAWHRHGCYAYDGVLYARRRCRTCKTYKLARSKHCRVCDRCVARFDHHCGWINGCVGEENYRHFLAFLAATWAMLFYGAYLVAACAADLVLEKRLFAAQYTRSDTGETFDATWGIVVQYVMMQHGELCLLLLLCAIMGTVVFGFWCYHLNLARTNTTTNEAHKWGAIRGYYRHKRREAAERAAAAAAASAQEEQAAAQAAAGEEVEIVEGTRDPPPPPPPPDTRPASAKKKGERGEQPARRRTKDGSDAPAAAIDADAFLAEALNEDGMPLAQPTNTFDLGSWRANFAEVLWPRSRRAGAARRGQAVDKAAAAADAAAKKAKKKAAKDGGAKKPPPPLKQKSS